MRMKAAVMHAVGEPLVIEEVELDPPKAGEVLVRMVATGVCHSDLHFYTGDIPAEYPKILGHEGAGVVEQIGPGVTRVVPGDHVVLTFLPSCGECRPCHTGDPTLCDLGAKIGTGAMLDDTRRLRLVSDGREVNNFLLVSTFAEYSVVPEASVVAIDKNVPLERVCLLGCGFTTGFGAATHAVQIDAGDTVTIIGCGGLGLAAIQGAVLSGAEKIIAVDLHEEKLAMARDFGATHTINNRHDADAVIEEIMAITYGAGTDFSLEFVGGDQTDETADIAFRAIRKGGTMVMCGVGSVSKRTMPIDPFTLTLWRKRIIGVLFGDSRFRVDIPRYIELYKQQRINLDDIVTREMGLEDINTAFQDLLAGNKVARQVIRF